MQHRDRNLTRSLKLAGVQVSRTQLDGTRMAVQM